LVQNEKTGFEVITGQQIEFKQGDKSLSVRGHAETKEKYAALHYELDAQVNQPTTLIKFAVNLSSENHPKEQLENKAIQYLDRIHAKGFDHMLAEQEEAWAKNGQ